MGGRERALGDARDSPRIPSGRALRSCVSKPEFYSLGGPAAGDGYRRHIGAKVRHITIALRAATELKRLAAAPGQVWAVKVFGVAIKSEAACACFIRISGTFPMRFWCFCALLQSAATLTLPIAPEQKNRSPAHPAFARPARHPREPGHHSHGHAQPQPAPPVAPAVRYQRGQQAGGAEHAQHEGPAPQAPESGVLRGIGLCAHTAPPVVSWRAACGADACPAVFSGFAALAGLRRPSHR